ncbi:hypothetical protein [Pseudomonas sp. P1.8]|uniref:hypothetical protein n=1 Tax=Pseudomonas sp. P1.8 TaxID=1699310 RepID=UPI0012E2CFDB|nr:hypothetical protein [Pseudomonas sp. P1.8]
MNSISSTAAALRVAQCKFDELLQIQDLLREELPAAQLELRRAEQRVKLVRLRRQRAKVRPVSTEPKEHDHD